MLDHSRRIVLVERPSEMVQERNLAVEEVPAPEPAEGEALVQVQYLSIDPTIRTWMNDAAGYLPPIPVGGVVRSLGVGTVLKSRTGRYGEGDLVMGMTGWQDFVVVGSGAPADPASMEVLPSGTDPLVALSALGITGLAAYFGMMDIGRVVRGDTVVVSGAAGATGSAAGQIARIKGASRVVGIAGTADKCRWIRDELGFDAAVNYRTDDVAARLHDACPDGIDLFFDNVGGSILDTCLAQLAMRGRVVLCGAISTYNDSRPPAGLRNYRSLIVRRGRMEGFIILDYLDRFPEARAEMMSWVDAGRLKHHEHVVDGLEHAPDALNRLFSGDHNGKVIVRL